MKLTKLPPADPGMPQLAGVELSARNRGMLDRALENNGGDAAWQGRKKAEAEDLLRLSQVAPRGRLHVDRLDLTEHLRAVLFMGVPVACRPDGDGELRVARFAVMGLVYPRDVLQKRLPGLAFLQIFEPHDVWLAQVGEVGQPLCLGPYMPVGIPVVELVLGAYGALTMQTAMIDEFDPAGVLNVTAARWWQQNVDRMPLSRTPFLVPGN